MASSDRAGPLPASWLVYYTDDNKAYYHNTLTGATQWDRPTGGGPGGLPGLPALEGSGSFDNDDDSSPSPRQAASGAVDLSKPKNDKKASGDPGADPFGGANSPPPGPGEMFSFSGRTVVGSMNVEDPDVAKGGRLRQDSAEGAVKEVGAPGKCCYCVDVGYLQSHFDISTQDVTKRLYLALLPHHAVTTSGESDFRRQPDFYGPFWVATTLTILIFAASNSARYLGGAVGTNYIYLVVAAAVTYGFCGAVPTLAWLLVKFSGSRASDGVTIRQLLCVYGYSLVVCAPLALLCLIPVSALKWVFTTLALVDSLAFLYVNLYNDLADALPHFRYLLLTLFFGSQVAFFCTFPLYFFKLT